MYNIYIYYIYVYIYSWQKIWCNGINATVRLWTGEQDLVRGHDEDLHGILIDSRLSCAPAVAEAVVKASTTACEESLREEISSTHLQTVQVRWRHLNKAFVCCTWKYIASSWGSSAKWCPPRSHRWTVISTTSVVIRGSTFWAIKDDSDVQRMWVASRAAATSWHSDIQHPTQCLGEIVKRPKAA